MKILEIFYLLPILLASSSVGLICFFYARKVSSLTIALSAPLGLATLSFIGIISKALLGSLIGKYAFGFGIYCATIFSIGLVITMGRFEIKFISKEFAKYALIFFIVCFSFALFSPIRLHGLESLQIMWGSDHTGYLEGGWFLLSEYGDVPQFHSSIDLLTYKGGSLISDDSRALVFGLISTLSSLSNIPWSWSYLPTGLLIYGMLGAVFMAVPQKWLIKLLVFLLFSLSQFFDIVMMGYLGKAFFWLFTITFTFRLLRFGKQSVLSNILLGCLLSSIYSVMPFFLILSSITGSALIFCSLQFNHFISYIKKYSYIFIQLGYIFIGGLISTGWSRNYTHNLNIGGAVNIKTPFDPINLLLIDWDFAWWGSQNAYSNLELYLGFCFFTLGMIFVFREVLLRNFNSAIPFLAGIIFSSICFIPSMAWVSYQLTSLPLLLSLLGIGSLSKGSRSQNILAVIIGVTMFTILSHRMYSTGSFHLHNQKEMISRTLSRGEFKNLINCSADAVINIDTQKIDISLATGIYLLLFSEGAKVQLPETVKNAEAYRVPPGKSWNPGQFDDDYPGVVLSMNEIQSTKSDCIQGIFKISN